MRIAALMFAAALAACSPPAPDAAEAQAEATHGLVIESPASGARVTSPLVATGTAPGPWYFEAVFPARLEAADGTVLAEAPAQAQSDWMSEGPVAFRAELVFEVEAETEAALVLEEDMPGDGAEPHQVRVPVILTP